MTYNTRGGEITMIQLDTVLYQQTVLHTVMRRYDLPLPELGLNLCDPLNSTPPPPPAYCWLVGRNGRARAIIGWWRNGDQWPRAEFSASLPFYHWVCDGRQKKILPSLILKLNLFSNLISKQYYLRTEKIVHSRIAHFKEENTGEVTS